MIAISAIVIVAIGLVATVVAINASNGESADPGDRSTDTTGRPRTRAEQISTSAAYGAREDRYMDALLSMSTASDWAGLEATKAVALFEQAARSGDLSRIDEANDLIDADLDAIDAVATGGTLHHGGPLVLITVYLRYADQPELLYPATAERIKTGRKADGTVDEAHSLVEYRDLIFEPYDVDGVGFDIEEANPWEPRPTSDYNGTENHKLQILTAAMLLTEVYADEEFDGRPVKDDTPETDDYWHYFRDAFFRYSGKWAAGYPTDHFGRDVAGEEKDASQYTRAYVQDYWLLRDLHSDPVVRAHAEVLLDRTLIDMAEDTVMGMYTGAAGRYYTPQPSEGINQNVHILDYLLFDSLGYELPLDHANRWGFAAWGYANILASDYNPTSPDFPTAIVDLAVEKEDGYLSRNGLERQANWVERDFALGFRVAGRTYGEGQSGGFYVADRAERGAGLAVIMYFGDTPFQKGRPTQTLDGVVDRRVAVVRNAHHDEELKLWIKEGFDEVELTEDWLFVRQPTVAGREVYLAVHPTTGSLRDGGELADPLQTGTVVVVERNDDPLVWEVSTSDEHESFAAFRADVLDNALEATDDRITYTSSTLGVEIAYDRREHTAHEVDGTPVDWTQFDHGFQTPWSSNMYGSYAATLEKGGHRVAYDWGPDDEGNFDQMPTKVVDGRSTFG